MKLVLGLILGFAVGLVAAYFSLPSPAPPALMGAALVVSMTLGHMVMDRYLASRDQKSTNMKKSGEAL